MRFRRCKKGRHELTPSNLGYQRMKAGNDSWFCRLMADIRAVVPTQVIPRLQAILDHVS